MGESQNRSACDKVPVGEAVLLGALAPGVNQPTWVVLKCAMLALGACLAVMLYVALYSSSMVMVFHVLVLVMLSGMLFLLLNWFLSQTGIVSVEQQMKDMNLQSRQEIGEKDM
eukprot:Gb_14333 [translate_table: standard]